MSGERINTQVVGLIGLRLGLQGRNYHKGDRLRDLPEVVFPNSVNTLFDSPSLWLKAEGVKFTPSLLVKSFFVRKDGKEIKIKPFSVFIADNKRYIAEKWGIVQKEAWNKQKNQYWREDFVKAIFTHVVYCENSEYITENKIAYKIREDISLEEMEAIFLQANNKVLEIINKKDNLSR